MICFSVLLFLAILLVDVVCISWRLIEIQPIETTLLPGSAVFSVREGKHAHNVGHLLTHTWSRFYESSQQRYANVATVTWLARHFETVKFSITSSPRARPSNWANAELYRYKIVAVSLHKTHICVVKSLVKIAAVSWHSLRRFIKPAPDNAVYTAIWMATGQPVQSLIQTMQTLQAIVVNL